MRGLRAHQGRRSCDTRAATPNAAPFTRELSFTTAPPRTAWSGKSYMLPHKKRRRHPAAACEPPKSARA